MKEEKLTPMMEQYLAEKEKNPDALLFFRLGDFFEMFNDDAVTASKELNLTLTHRQNCPMCGVPAQALDNYLQKLVAKGYRVAVVDQVGEATGKGLTDRKLTKIVTPGTILTDDSLSNSNNNFLILILEIAEEIALAGADVSTGEIFYSLYADKNREKILYDEIYRLNPHEILFSDLSFENNLKSFAELKLDNFIFTKIEIDNTTNFLQKHFDEKFFPAADIACIAVENLLAYLHNTIKSDLNHISKLTRLNLKNHLMLDANTLKNLEIIKNLRDGSKKNTLFDILDLTKTPLGTRLLRKRLENPLTDPAAIMRRYDSVEELFKNFTVRKNLRDNLKEIHDIERLMTKIEVGSANARDLTALKISFRVLPKIFDTLKNIRADILIACRDGLKNFDTEVELIDRAISEDAPLSIRDGGIINRGYDNDLDDYRKISQDSRSFLQEFEEAEKIRTGIKSLKVGYNKVFGYYIEIRNSGADKIPANYIRRQTLTQAERYITPELKDFETKILGAQEKIVTLEYNIFCRVRDEIKKKLFEIQDTAKRIAILDVTAALAETAAINNYVRPELNLNGKIEISDGRHPLIEKILKNNLFVPNDTDLEKNRREIMIITGPNMAGKSTYMRQVALIILMAQVGSFIPAKSANISPVDRIFTRIGAGDDLVSGKSTFMVEMNEVAEILKFATDNSLIILDEVGRGTSTFDGMSIARAVIEYIDKKIRAKTLFATHYHELTDLAEKSDRIENFSVAVKERGSEIIFLRRIKPGGADKSYGIQVAKLAGLPKSVMKRAEEILIEMEKNQPEKIVVEKKINPAQNLFISDSMEEFLKLDVTTLTPIEAMNALFEWQKKFKIEFGK